VAGATAIAAENMIQGFVVVVASGTGQTGGSVIENGSLPGRRAVADIALCRRNDVSCRFVVAVATAAGPLHFTMVRRENGGPRIGSLFVAGATTVAARNVVQGLIVAVASGTSLDCRVVVENGSLPGRIAVADIALCCGNDVSR